MGLLYKGHFKKTFAFPKGFKFPVTVPYGCQYADVHIFIAMRQHHFPIDQGFLELLKVVMEMTQADNRVGIVDVHLHYLVVNFLGVAIVLYLPVRVSHPCKDGYVVLIVKEVLLPNFDGLVKVIKGLEAVGQAKESLIIAGMIGQAALIKEYRIPVIALFAQGISHSHQRIIVTFGCREDL